MEFPTTDSSIMQYYLGGFLQAQWAQKIFGVNYYDHYYVSFMNASQLGSSFFYPLLLLFYACEGRLGETDFSSALLITYIALFWLALGNQNTQFWALNFYQFCKINKSWFLLSDSLNLSFKIYRVKIKEKIRQRVTKVECDLCPLHVSACHVKLGYSMELIKLWKKFSDTLHRTTMLVPYEGKKHCKNLKNEGKSERFFLVFPEQTSFVCVLWKKK